MRISREDVDNPGSGKRRHFEISIDSPFTILNCRATRENLALPEYSNANFASVGQQHNCGCPNSRVLGYSPKVASADIPALSNMDNSSSALLSGPLSSSVYPGDSAEGPGIPSLPRPPQAHLSNNGPGGVQRETAPAPRPIHLMRVPSYNPPAFDEDEPPPPAMTPPPLYDHIIGTPSHDGLADYFARYVKSPFLLLLTSTDYI